MSINLTKEKATPTAFCPFQIQNFALATYHGLGATLAKIGLNFPDPKLQQIAISAQIDPKLQKLSHNAT